MLVLSLQSQVEEANTGGGKALGGAIRSFEFLMDEGALANLERAHPGVFAYLAFHPTADRAIADYVQEGTLPGDSGPHLMVLFTTSVRATWPIELTKVAVELPFLDVQTNMHPAYEAVRELFDPRVPPPLPGIAFFRSFTGEHDVVYVNLSDCDDATEVRQRLRSLCSSAESAYQGSEGKRHRDFADDLATSLEADRLEFMRTGRIALRQWLIRTYRFAEQHAGDIVSAVGLI
jgi:hypothetical protein